MLFIVILIKACDGDSYNIHIDKLMKYRLDKCIVR